MRARVAWMGGFAAVSLAGAIVGCRGIAGVEEAYLVEGSGGASQGGSAGAANGGAAGEGTGGVAGEAQGDSGQGGDAGAGGECSDPYLVCGGDCVDPRTDRRHCGKCERGCLTNQICSDSQCNDCLPGQSGCGTECIDTSSDPYHCGSCGNACPDQGFCTNSACQKCVGPEIGCPGIPGCVNPENDPSNCGWCGRSCSGPAGCAAGACIPEMLQGLGNPTSLASDGWALYWTSELSDDPWGRIFLSSSFSFIDEAVGDAGRAPTALSFDPTNRYLFWGATDSASGKRLLRGANADAHTILFSVPVSLTNDVFQTIVHNNFVYYTLDGGNEVGQLDFGGYPVVLNNGLDKPLGLVAHGDTLFVATSSQIVTLNASSPSGALTFADSQGRPRFVAKADKDIIVWENAQSKEIRRRSASGAGDLGGELVNTGFDNLRGLVAAEDAVYYAATDMGVEGIFVTRAVPKAKPRLVSKANGNVVAMAVDPNYVYWTTADNAIWRVSRGPTPP